MFDESLVYSLLKEIESSVRLALSQTERVRSADDFTSTQDGVFLMGGVCMQLIVIGEKVKALDKKTDGQYLVQYPEVPWKEIMGLRNIIAHEYHSVDEDEIFNILKNDLPVLLEVVKRMEDEI